MPDQYCVIALGASLDEGEHGAAELLLVGVVRLLGDLFRETVEAVLDDLVGRRVHDLGSGSARALGVDEREGGREGGLANQREGLEEVLLFLAREADDDVGREGEVWHRGAQPRDELEVLLARVAAVHGLQDARRAALDREVEVGHHRGGLRHGGDDLVGEVLGV